MSAWERLLAVIVVGFFTNLAISFWIASWINFANDIHAERDPNTAMILGFICVYLICLLIRLVTGRGAGK